MRLLEEALVTIWHVALVPLTRLLADFWLLML
jgi:hypothetical protein